MIDNEGWAPYVGQKVIVDTDSQFVYLGTLQEVRDHFLVMVEVDVHDRHEGPSTKEQYIMDAKRFGIHVNRKEASIRKSVVVSISRLDDVVIY